MNASQEIPQTSKLDSPILGKKVTPFFRSVYEDVLRLTDLVETAREHVSNLREAHTDNKGSKQSNQKLSEARAKAVREYLINKGIDGSRLVAKGFGETVPVADNSTEEGRYKNRRVDFKILQRD
jgi:outer membrane protein OmpA-like peptidoglycan-associated protein